MRRILYLLMIWPFIANAQFNTDRLVMIGRSALYYEDYVLSIQYFNQAISAKPYLYEPWFFRGVAKFYLDDFRGAESDCTQAIERNPYVVTIYELRGLCRITRKNIRKPSTIILVLSNIIPITRVYGITASSVVSMRKTMSVDWQRLTRC